MENQGAGGKRLVVVVADPGRESAGALQWALSHAVLEQDDIILLHVEPMNARKTTTLSFLRRQAAGSPMESGGGGSGGEYYEFLYSMKAECKRKQPKVKVQIERVEMEDKDKAITILTHADVLGAGLLVIGQRRNSGTFIG